jgi:hypothetical protein
VGGGLVGDGWHSGGQGGFLIEEKELRRNAACSRCFAKQNRRGSGLLPEICIDILLWINSNSMRIL